jgi:cytochrome c peroxidase
LARQNSRCASRKTTTGSLRGIRNTAPYFHNNSAATLEAVVDHYIEFFKVVQANAAPRVVPPDPEVVAIRLFT